VTYYRICNNCDSALVLRTASQVDLSKAKAESNGNPLVYSPYLVYTLGPEEVDVAVIEKRRRQKEMKQDIADRRQYAESARFVFPSKRAPVKKSKPSKGKKVKGAVSTQKKRRS